MSSCNRFYRFSEFGRELVYDIEGANAFFLTEAEARLLDCLQEKSLQGKTLYEECIAALQGDFTQEDIKDAVEHIESEGLLREPQTPYQPLSKVYTLTLNISQECNLQCKYCYVQKPDSNPYMSEEVARKAVDFIAGFDSMEQFSVSFYGGEPLLNFPVMQAVMEYASKKAEEGGYPEVKYHITTNGTLITDEIVDFLAAYDVEVMISLDGPAPIHDALRVTPAGEGSHERVAEALQKLIKAQGNHKVSASSVITNQSRLQNVYEYLSQFPLKDIKISYVRYLDEGKERTYALSESQKREYMADMKDLAVECLNLIMKGVRPPYYNFENKLLQLWKHAKRGYFCPAGLTRFGISPGGDIYPCGPAADMGEWKLGTVEHGLDVKRVNQWAALSSFENKKECKACWAQYLCAGGCPLQMIHAIDENRCEISQYSTELAIALYAAIKEENEMMLASLVDQGFLESIRKFLQEKQL